MIRSDECFVEPNDVRMVDVFDDGHLLGDHLYLFLAHRLDFYHLYGETIKLAFLAAFEDLTGGSRPDLPNELVVAYFLQSLSHIIFFKTL